MIDFPVRDSRRKILGERISMSVVEILCSDRISYHLSVIKIFFSDLEYDPLDAANTLKLKGKP